MIGQSSVRRLHAQEHVIVARSGPVDKNVVDEPGRHRAGQRHGQRVACLLLHDGDHLRSPVNVRQPQADDVAGTQSRREHQQSNGRIPSVHDLGRTRLQYQPFVVVAQDRKDRVGPSRRRPG